MKKPLRPIRIVGDIAYIPLTRGYEAIIDAADVPLVEGRSWYANVTPSAVYAQSRSPDGSRTAMMHREILSPQGGMVVDHADRNGLNNRRRNLRESTVSQNQHNRKLNSNSSSGFKGVFWQSSTKSWGARLRINGESIYLGVYKDPKDAAQAIMAEREARHGEYARHS